jgi:hypothetical protein
MRSLLARSSTLLVIWCLLPKGPVLLIPESVPPALALRRPPPKLASLSFPM